VISQVFGAIDGDIEESAEAMALGSRRDYMVVLEIHEVPGHILRASKKLALPFRNPLSLTFFTPMENRQ
jgi:hypothetical protein